MKVARSPGRDPIELSTSPDRLILTFRLTKSLTLGSQQRANQISSRAAAMLKRGRPLTLVADSDGIVGHFEVDKAEAVRKITARLRTYATTLATAPLHPKIVEEALGITALERSRWTKDGRLPRTGAGSFGLGKRAIFFPLYPIDMVRKLIERPDIIEVWRLSDRQEGRS
ncbi:hypothetical protein [Ancylobacter mangrovi]|uniref:hypothetical protein n=1 Tax=Ancylobacter mangrovi TaxID=2972472 RepID=UPI002162F90F|nr:hypothetical protein [Ancylobacter mangrovi]MCS0504741.1 hypothetical protein [Ancylobacter mangrovi]